MTKSQILNTSHTVLNNPSIDGASNYSDNQLVPLSKISYGGLIVVTFRLDRVYIYTGSGSSYKEVESINLISTGPVSIRRPNSGETLVVEGLTGNYDDTTRVSVKYGLIPLTTSFIKPGQEEGEGDLVINKPGSNFYAIIPSNAYVGQTTLTATKTGNESRTSTAELIIGSTAQSDNIQPSQYKAAIQEQSSGTGGGIIRYSWRTIYSSTNFVQSGSTYTLTIPNSSLSQENEKISSNYIYITKTLNGNATKIRVTGDNTSSCNFGLVDPIGNNNLEMLTCAYFPAPGYMSISPTRAFNYTVEALSSTNKILDTIKIRLIITHSN